jgi:serine/threonine protein kinase
MHASLNIERDIKSRLEAATHGQYEIVSELGRGGMAAVFLARELSLGRMVALKVMLPHLSVFDGMVERFLLEARTAAQLEHANIVPVYAAQQRDGLLFFAMKYVDGVSLDHLLERVGPMTVETVRFVVSRLADALQYAHEHGVTHRDVKPGNVMIDWRGNPMLTDFGIARVASSPRLTQQGLVIGTPIYMSPEQLRGEEPGAASDQYSLGVLTYEMLAGKPPFTGSSLELATAHLQTVPCPLSNYRSECPEPMARAVMRMLEKSPSARWPSLEAMIDEMAKEGPPESTGARRQFVALLRPTDTVDSTPAQPTTTSASESRDMASGSARRPLVDGFVAGWKASVRHRRTVLAGATIALAATVAIAARHGSNRPVEKHCETKPTCVTKPDSTRLITDTTITKRENTDSSARDSVPFSLALDSVRMTTGESMTMALRVGVSTDSSRGPVQWASTRPSIVVVSATGVLRARSAGGPVWILAMRGADTARARVWVEPKPVARIRLQLVERATVGDTVQLGAHAVDADGAEVPNVRFWVTVSDSSIGQIVRTDQIAAKAPGVLAVTVTTGPVTTQAHIIVSARSVPVLGAARVAEDLAELVAAIAAQDTARVAKALPSAEGALGRQAFVAWVQNARRLTARLDSMDAPVMTSSSSARVDFTLVFRWKTTLHRPQKRVSFVAEYGYAHGSGWHLTSLRPTSALPD